MREDGADGCSPIKAVHSQLQSLVEGILQCRDVWREAGINVNTLYTGQSNGSSPGPPSLWVRHPLSCTAASHIPASSVPRARLHKPAWALATRPSLPRCTKVCQLLPCHTVLKTVDDGCGQVFCAAMLLHDLN